MWLLIILRALFWAILTLLLLPVLMIMRIDQRIDYAEDLAFGYDDDDPGVDVDE